MFFLLGKEECELCDKAEQILASLGFSQSNDYKKLDILKDEYLSSRYGWHIPVLIKVATSEYNGWDKHEAEEQLLSSYLQNQLIQASETSTEEGGASIEKILNSEGDSLELFWPFPPSRARDFIKVFETKS